MPEGCCQQTSSRFVTQFVSYPPSFSHPRRTNSRSSNESKHRNRSPSNVLAITYAESLRDKLHWQLSHGGFPAQLLMPKENDPKLVFGFENCRWLRALKKSARNSSRLHSLGQEIGTVRRMLKSISNGPGPSTTPVALSPNAVSMPSTPIIGGVVKQEGRLKRCKMSGVQHRRFHHEIPQSRLCLTASGSLETPKLR